MLLEDICPLVGIPLYLSTIKPRYGKIFIAYSWHHQKQIFFLVILPLNVCTDASLGEASRAYTVHATNSTLQILGWDMPTSP